jgi:serine/threonine protein phosphatase 1
MPVREMSSDKDRFAILRKSGRVWAVAAIHGEAARLERIHAQIEERFLAGDRLVYLGNCLGRGPAVAAAVDELLSFRRRLLARRGMFAYDIAYLRGSQEEMWQKLLQLQFAPNPREVFEFMLDQGVGATVEAYGGSIETGRAHLRDGPLSLTRWTSSLRAGMQRQPGHYALMSILRRAAYTDDGRLLFVHAGLDPERPLGSQGDSLWWGSARFGDLGGPYEGFKRIVRGFDRAHGGAQIGAFVTTLDAGSGFGGPLIAGCLDADGTLAELIEA